MYVNNVNLRLSEYKGRPTLELEPLLRLRKTLAEQLQKLHD